MSEYKEHNKLLAVKDKSQIIGEFIEWLRSGEARDDGEPVHLAYYGDEEDEMFLHLDRIEKILARFFDIDLNKLEEEKLAMLAELRGKEEGAQYG